MYIYSSHANYVHFWTNTRLKVINPLIQTSSYALNGTTTDL